MSARYKTGDFCNPLEPDEMYFARPLDDLEKRGLLESIRRDSTFRDDLREALGLKRIDDASGSSK